MERELARHVIKVGLHSSAVLEGLIPLLREHCDPAEFDRYLKAIASVTAEMGITVFEAVFAEYPDLRIEMEEKVQKYGQFV